MRRKKKNKNKMNKRKEKKAGHEEWKKDEKGKID